MYFCSVHKKICRLDKKNTYYLNNFYIENEFFQFVQAVYTIYTNTQYSNFWQVRLCTR